MSCHSRKFVSTTLVFSMTFLFLTPQVVAANDHLVKAAELHQALLAASQARMANMAKIQRVFATETARVAAGALSNQEITYIIIALATAVLILVIVAA